MTTAERCPQTRLPCGENRSCDAVAWRDKLLDHIAAGHPADLEQIRLYLRDMRRVEAEDRRLERPEEDSRLMTLATERLADLAQPWKGDPELLWLRTHKGGL